MKIDKQNIEDHQVQLTVEIEPATFDEYRKRAARKVAQQVKIPGFRPGKAPYQVVLRAVGEPAIAEEAVELLVDALYPKILEEAEVEPSAPGHLNNIKSLDPLVLEFVVPRKAEVILGDYKGIRIPYEPQELPSTQVDDVVKRLQESQALIETVQRPAIQSDVVSGKLAGVKIDSDGQAGELILDERPTTINILAPGEDSDREWPFQGFSQHLTGHSAGEVLDIEHTFPDDYYNDTLKGAKARYTISIEEVKSKTLPEINDEFAMSAGEYASMDELREAIKKDLATHALEEYHEQYNQQIMDQVIEQSEYHYPAQLIDNEVNDVIQRLESRLSNQGMELDLYLKAREMDMDALRAESRPVAEKRLKRTLAIMEISEREAVKVEDDELQEETMRTLNQYAQMLPEKEMKRLLSREGTNQIVGSVMMDLLVAKTMGRLRDYARGIDPMAVSALEEQPAESETEPSSSDQTNLPVVSAPDTEA